MRILWFGIGFCFLLHGISFFLFDDDDDGDYWLLLRSPFVFVEFHVGNDSESR